MKLTRIVLRALLSCAVIAGCSSNTGSATGVASTVSDVTVPTADRPFGLAPLATRSIVVVDGLNGPTQFGQLDDGRFLIAQLNGEEEAQAGQVLVVDPASGAKTVLLDKLDKPTGVIYHEGAIWVMVRRGLLRADWDGATAAGPVAVVLKDLPYNGRSEGTLTVMADDRIAYETTGNDESGDVTENSGRLWAYDPATSQSTAIGVGLKNAYAHALLPDGRLAVTEIGDNISDAPLEEINLVDTTATMPAFGWPNCPAPQQCTGIVSPLATFDPKATPAGIALSPDGLSLYVTLLVTGELRQVSLADGTQQLLRTGLQAPLHALTTGDGQLLVGEHAAGRIVAVTQ